MKKKDLTKVIANLLTELANYGYTISEILPLLEPLSEQEKFMFIYGCFGSDTYSIDEEYAMKINSTKDLNDVFAYLEEGLTDIECELREYIFPESCQEKIDKFMEDICYKKGEYDKENITRIFGVLFLEELEDLLK